MAKATTEDPTTTSAPAPQPDTSADLLAPLLARLWERFQDGDNQALFDLIVWSLAGGQAPPPEASTVFVERYDRWFKLEVRTLDEAFGVERPKGMQIDDQAAERERLRPYIVLRVEAWRKDKPAGRELFETIAKDFGKSRSYVEELYYEKESAAWRKAGEAGVFRLVLRPKSETSQGIPSLNRL